MARALPLSLLESADLLGRYRYLELSLFSLLGERAAAASDARLGAFLSSASGAHGFRAALIEARLPVSVGLPDVASCTRSPSPVTDEALGAVVQGSDEECLEGLVGVLYPAMAEAYEAHLRICSPYSDAHITRMLERSLADLEVVTGEGAGLAGQVGALVSSGEPPAARSGFARGLEELLAKSGGPFGPLRPR